MSNIQEEYLLNNDGINKISQSIGSWAEDMGLDLKMALRIRLSAEEILMRISNHYGEDQKGTLYTGKRFGTPYIRFRYHGDAFNPVRNDTDAFGEWGSQLLANMGLSPAWSYRSGENEVMFRISVPRLSPELLMLTSLIAAVLLGVSGSFLPAAMVSVLSDYILKPLSDLFLNLLNIFVGLLVFLSVVNGTIGIGDASEFGRIGKKMLSRFIILSFIANGVTLILARFAFALNTGNASGGSGLGKSILKIIMECVPANPVKPFYDGNTLQIIFLAIMISMILLSVGERSATLKAVFSESNIVINEAVSVICKLLPIYIFSSLTLQFWDTGIKTLAKLWKPVLVAMVICLLFFTVKVLYTSFKVKVGAGLLIRKILPPMIVGYTTASSSSAFGISTETCENKLGISSQLTRIGIPLGSILYFGIAAVLYMVISFFAADTYNVVTDMTWLINAWLLTSILSCATPPVSGGTLACIGIISAQLGIPGQALALSATLCVLLDFVCTGTRIGMILLELTLQANQMEMLDRDILCKGN